MISGDQPAGNRGLRILVLLLALALCGLWQGRSSRSLTSQPPSVPPAVFVGLQGAVARPGIYVFHQLPSLNCLLQQAGGPQLPTGSDLYLPSGEMVTIAANGQITTAPLPGAVRLTLGLPLDLNRATAADLEAVPGLGPVLARRLVQYREKQGPFRDLEQLLNISGIGAVKLEQIRPYLAVR